MFNADTLNQRLNEHAKAVLLFLQSSQLCFGSVCLCVQFTQLGSKMKPGDSFIQKNISNQHLLPKLYFRVTFDIFDKQLVPHLGTPEPHHNCIGCGHSIYRICHKKYPNASSSRIPKPLYESILVRFKSKTK